MTAQTDIKFALFRNHDQTLTLWVEKVFDDGALLGWCPELSTNMLAPPDNVVKTGAGA